MNAADDPIMLAKVTWEDPESGETRELPLAEGMTITIGRLEFNEICIREQHVSRQHASIAYRDGVFVITDLGSANGVFVNDQRLSEPFPLASGDQICLYVPLLRFDALMDEESQRQATEHGARLGIKLNEEQRQLAHHQRAAKRARRSRCCSTASQSGGRRPAPNGTSACKICRCRARTRGLT